MKILIGVQKQKQKNLMTKLSLVTECLKSTMKVKTSFLEQ